MRALATVALVATLSTVIFETASAQEKPAQEKASEETKRPETAPGTQAEASPASPTQEGEEAPAIDSTPDASDSEGQGDADAPSEAEAQGDTATPEGAVGAPTEEGRKSASANQAAEIPQEDDYDGATDDALVESGKRTKDLSLGIALDLTWPLGKAANYIGSASIQGLSLDLRYYAWGNIGVGVGVALDSLSKKSTTTAEWQNATITGTQLREINFTPVLAKGYYAWRDQERFIPYVAAGFGAARTVRRLMVGFSSLSDASWHFVVAPEAGLQIPAGPTVLLTNVRLNYLPPAAGVEEQIFANFSVGLSIQ